MHINEIFGLIKSIGRFAKYVWGKFSSFIIRHPYKTLSITHINREMACWWHMGSRNENEAMQVGGDFLITNLTDHEIRLCGAELGKKNKTRGTILLKELHTPYSSTTYALQPRKNTEVRVIFLVQPPIIEVGKVYIDDLAIIDNFGNKHWIKQCRFVYH